MKRLIVFLISSLVSTTFAQSSFKKVLFLGNSITKHGPKADIDWAGNWGMAASAEAKDYVHLFTASLAQKQGSAPHILVKNIADFERAYASYDFHAKQKDAIDFQADLIVLAIGENIGGVKTVEEKSRLQQAITNLLNSLKNDRKTTIIVRSGFWANAAKDEALRSACDAVGGIYCDLSAISADKSLYGRAERAFKNPGVANHPGDKGMAAIAEALMNALLAKAG